MLFRSLGPLLERAGSAFEHAASTGSIGGTVFASNLLVPAAVACRVGVSGCEGREEPGRTSSLDAGAASFLARRGGRRVSGIGGATAVVAEVHAVLKLARRFASVDSLDGRAGRGRGAEDRLTLRERPGQSQSRSALCVHVQAGQSAASRVQESRLVAENDEAIRRYRRLWTSSILCTNRHQLSSNEDGCASPASRLLLPPRKPSERFRLARADQGGDARC